MGAIHGKCRTNKPNQRSRPDLQPLLQNHLKSSIPIGSAGSPSSLAHSMDAVCSKPLPSATISQPIQVIRTSDSHSTLSSMGYHHTVQALSPPPSRASSPRVMTNRPTFSVKNRPRRRPSGSHPFHTTPRPPSTSAVASASTSPTFPYTMLIREALYAAFAEVLATYTSIPTLISRDPARAFFTTISLALLSISLSSISSDGNPSVPSIFNIDPSELVASVECLNSDDSGSYRTLLEELVDIGKQGRELEQEDDNRAVMHAAHGKDPPDRRVNRVRWILERGIGYVNESGKMRGEKLLNGREFGKTMLFASRINKLARRVVNMRNLFENKSGEEILADLVNRGFVRGTH